MIYLDHNATTPLHPAARRAMEVWLDLPANPMSMHRWGRDVAAAIDRARAQVAAAVGAQPGQVFFTSGASEATNWLLSQGVWAVSAVEHPSVRSRATHILPVDGQGRCWPGQDIPGITGISVMLANNETGVLQPVEDWLAWCRARGLALHVDAVQGPGKVFVEIQADYLTLSSHKVGGPQGVGALVCRGEVPEVLIRGGPQERARRAGTHNVMGIVGFGAAIEAARPLTSTLRDHLEARLVEAGGVVAGAGASRLPNTLCIHFPGIEAQDLVVALDMAGIGISAGSACASGSPEPSSVLKAMAFPGSAVRFSLGPQSTLAEVSEAAERTVALLPQLSSLL